jgi:hypothetical protein
MAEIRINATGGVKLYDADDSHYAQIVAGTITSNVNAITLGHDVVSIVDNLALTSDSAVLKFGADNDTTLTHTDGTGLTLNSTNKLCFNDASQFVQGSSGTVLSIGATDEIDLTATAVDLNGTLDVSGTSQFNAAVTLAGTTPTLTIGDAGAEDTKIVFDGNAQDFHIGLDDTADDLVIGLGSTLGTTTHMAFDETGAITKPLQPSFLAKMSALRSNVTGDNTAYTVAFDTEITDRNADFNTSNYTFTAPVTGLYQINISFLFEGAGDGNEIYHKLVTSNRTKSQQQHVSGTNFGTKVGQNSSHLVDMDASDTATVVVVSAGGTKTLDVYHEDYTHFSGHLVC